MLRTILLPAAITGTFCGAFAVGIDVATDMLERGSEIVLSFASGFLGSVFASVVLGKAKRREAAQNEKRDAA